MSEELFTQLGWVEHTEIYLRIDGQRVELHGAWDGGGTLRGWPGEGVSWSADAKTGAGVPVDLRVEVEARALKFTQRGGPFSIDGVFARIDCSSFRSTCEALGENCVDPHACRDPGF